MTVFLVLAIVTTAIAIARPIFDGDEQPPLDAEQRDEVELRESRSEETRASYRQWLADQKSVKPSRD